MFVRTQNGEKVEVRHMSFVSVEPDDIQTNIWKLFVKTFNKDGRSTGTKLIADFDSVQKANAAFSSLKIAYSQRLGWDASEYVKGHQ